VNGTRKEKSSFFHWKNLEVKKHFAVELNVKMLQINLSWSLSSVNNGDVGGFLQQYNWSTWYNWITDEGGVKSYWLNQINRSITMHCFVLNTIQSLFLPSLVRIGWVFSENFEIIIQIRWRWICPILRMDYRICTTALMFFIYKTQKIPLLFFFFIAPFHFK
jgi:hypothetical protein